LPNCYTCGNEIVFDKNILSKTGKQIPLWADKKNTHGHDEQGNAVRGPLPTQNLSPQQTQQFNQYNRQQPFQQQQQQEVKPSSGFKMGSQPSQGGSYLDTKRLRVLTEELAKEISSINEKMEALYQLAKSNNAMLGELTQVFKITDPKSAAELYKSMNHTRNEALKKEPKVHGWNSVPNNMPTIDESKDFPVEETLKDDDDDDIVEDDNNTKGVIDDL
jgi:hypothetical protein